MSAVPAPIDDAFAEDVRNAAARIREAHPDKPIELVLERLKGFVDGLLTERARRA